MSRGIRIAVLGLLLALLTASRLRLVDHLRDQGYFAKYLDVADRIVRGDVPRERLGDLSPAYLAQVCLYRVLPFAGWKPLRALQVVGLTLAALFTGLAARRLAGAPAGIAALLLVLGNRAALVNAAELEPETLILLLNSAALALLIEVQHDGRGNARRGLLLAGVLLGLSIDARPAALLVLIALAGGLWLQGSRSAADRPPLSTRWRGAMLLVAAAALPVALALIASVSLTGMLRIMDPGYVFYEGMNPSATGAAGVDPVIAVDLENPSVESDPLHSAYRLVAARAQAGTPDPLPPNRYWTRKALLYAGAHPRRALELELAKARLAISSYEIYDLASMWRKDQELKRLPWIPTGVLVALALAALVLAPREKALLPLLYVLSSGLTLVVFYVSARQRNALLPGLAVLGGIGIAEILRRARTRPITALVAVAAVCAGAWILKSGGRVAREDLYGWFASEQRQRGLGAVAAASQDPVASRRANCWLATWPVGVPPDVPPDALGETALAQLSHAAVPERRFDLALALERAGDWADAERILRALEEGGYRPDRGGAITNSVAFYRARALLHLARAPEAREELAIAQRQAAGDARLLALQAALADSRKEESRSAEALRELARLHDPFTADLARALAEYDMSRSEAALDLVRRALAACPDWDRARDAERRLLAGRPL